MRAWLFAKLFPLVPLGRRFGRGDLVGRLLADVEALDTLFLVALGPISTAVLAGAAVTIVLAIFLPAAALDLRAAVLRRGPAGPGRPRPAAAPPVPRWSKPPPNCARPCSTASMGHQDLVLFEAHGRGHRPYHDRRRAARQPPAAVSASTPPSAGLVQVLAGAALVGTVVAGLTAPDCRAPIDGPLMAGLVLAVLASFEASAMLVRSATGFSRCRAPPPTGWSRSPTAPPPSRRPLILCVLPPGGEVRFENVRFGYDPAHPGARRPRSRWSAPANAVAIIGPSGAGKSTIAQPLLRPAEPQAGAIRINGRDLSRAGARCPDRPRRADDPGRTRLPRHRRRQPAHRARPEANDVELLARARRGPVLASSSVACPASSRPSWERRAAPCPVGQACRVALARTLLSPADILVFDEPTSGLDAPAEVAFLAELPRLTEGRTAIVITHRRGPGRLRSGARTARRQACRAQPRLNDNGLSRPCGRRHG